MAENKNLQGNNLRQNFVSVISLSSALAVGKFTLDFRDKVDSIVESRIAVLKPNSDYIREICRAELAGEINGIKEAHQQTRKEFERTIDQLVRFYERRTR